MAKKKSSTSSTIIIIFIFLIALFYSLISNIFNFEIITDYGPYQYFLNIIHLHKDYYLKANDNIKIFEEILTISDMKKTQPQSIIKKGDYFKFKGFEKKGEITWGAVYKFKNNSRIKGYILIPKNLTITSIWDLRNRVFGDDNLPNNEYFNEVNYTEIKKLKDQQLKIFKMELSKKINLEKATSAIDKQKLKESNKFKVIKQLSNQEIMYFCKSDDLKIVNMLYEAYSGNNFETIILNSNKNYDPKTHGVFSKPLINKWLDSIYFKIGMFIFLIIGLLDLKREKCPKCYSKKISIKDEVILEEGYKYQNKDGSPDKRRKDNPIIQRIRIDKICKKCNTEWSNEIIR